MGKNRFAPAGKTLKTQPDICIFPACARPFHPVSRRLVAKCDGCLRIGGPSKGADEMVSLARSFEKQVFFRYEDVPAAF